MFQRLEIKGICLFFTDGAHAGTDGGGVSIGDNAEEQNQERE